MPSRKRQFYEYLGEVARMPEAESGPLVAMMFHLLREALGPGWQFEPGSEAGQGER
jgi:hypothetical protein